MDHDMYPFPFYFVLIGVPEQLGVLNDLFLIVDKEIDMLRTVMHHIRFDFFCQFLKFHTVSGTFYLDDMFRIQKDIGSHCAVTGILTDFCSCQWIEWFQIGIEQMLDIILILDLQS